MAVPVQTSPQIPATPDQQAAAAVAAVKLVRASFEALAMQVGQQLAGKVVPGAPPGLTQIAIADQVLTLKLDVPLPPGTQVQVNVQPGTAGQPAVTVTPQALPQPQPQAAASLPLPAQPPTPLLPQQQAAPPPPVQPQTPPQPPQVPQASAPVPQPPAPQPAPAAPPPAASSPAPAAQPSAPAPVPAPAASAPPPAPVTPVTSAPPATVTVSAQSTPAPTPTPISTAPVPTQPVAPSPLPTPTPTPQTVGQSAPPSPVVQPSLSAPISVSTPAPTPPPATVPPVAAQTAIEAQAMPGGRPSAAPPGPSAAPPAVISTPSPVPTPTPGLSQRVAESFRQVAQATSPPPPAPGSPAQAAMSAATQAAARQQSAAPLLQALAADLPDLPPPVAQAALRVLAGRINLNQGAPPAQAIKDAVLRSGVFLEPPAKPGTPPDTKTALTQLRGALLAWLGDDVAPVAPVMRRPPPPSRGAPPRGQSPEPAVPAASGREAGKVLLNQTEGALSRIRLMQLSSQAPDAARLAATAPGVAAEWNLELPMMLGHELTMMHLQIDRDGKQKADPKERGWRLRFALKFSVLGEVGAQIAMLGGETSVTLWAEEDATAAVLEEMLPELGPALAAKGLQLGALRVRRGVPEAPAKPAGRLMDSFT